MLALALTMAVRLAASGPSLLVTLPGRPGPSIAVLFPEHVTALRHGSAEAEHLYRARPTDQPPWRRIADGFEFERDLPRDVHMLARAIIENDGVLFHYELTNRSAVA